MTVIVRHHLGKSGHLREIYESCTLALYVSEPCSYEEAAERSEWRLAMEEEMSAIEKNETWSLVDLPKDKKAIGLKWVFKTKYNPDGTLLKHKARLVVKGYSQRKGIGFEETFSPVARFETIRVVILIAAFLKLCVYQFDVKSAFLNGELSEEVYVAQPDGFVNQESLDKIYKLKKALYGLKQAPKAWYMKIDTYFLQFGFKRSENEPTMYIKSCGECDFLLVCLYVDDMIYVGSNSSLFSEFKDQIMQKFNMTDLGQLHYFLGMEVGQCKEGVFIAQRKYAMDLHSD